MLDAGGAVGARADGAGAHTGGREKAHIRRLLQVRIGDIRRAASELAYPHALQLRGELSVPEGIGGHGGGGGLRRGSGGGSGGGWGGGNRGGAVGLWGGRTVGSGRSGRGGAAGGVSSGGSYCGGVGVDVVGVHLHVPHALDALLLEVDSYHAILQRNTGDVLSLDELFGLVQGQHSVALLLLEVLQLPVHEHEPVGAVGASEHEGIRFLQQPAAHGVARRWGEDGDRDAAGDGVGQAGAAKHCSGACDDGWTLGTQPAVKLRTSPSTSSASSSGAQLGGRCSGRHRLDLGVSVVRTAS